MAFNLLELTDNGGGGMNTAVSPEEGSAEVTYRLYGTSESTPPTVSVISQVFDYFCGGVSNLAPEVSHVGSSSGVSSGGGGKIVRVLPPVHPFRPELSSAGVTSMVGVGQSTSGSAVRVFGLDPVNGQGFPLGQFPHFTQYDYRVKFVKRPYFLLPDSKIEVRSGLYYYPPDGSSGLLIFYADEWRRFTSTTRAPLPDTASATFGQMKHRTQSGALPDDKNFNGSPYLSLQNSTVEITWYNVPYRYMLDFTVGGASYKSYLTRFVGTVNQHEWNGYAAGSLLYLGATPTSYIPASPVQQKLLGALAVGLDQSLMCNIKLRFIHTARTGTDVPTTGHALLTNLNFVAAGHNLQPEYSKRLFYYCVTDATGAADSAKAPSFYSFPFQLFFTDPMLAQPAGPI